MVKAKWGVSLGLLLIGALCRQDTGLTQPSPAVGDQVKQIQVPVPGTETFCSIGLTFDGRYLYYDRCNDRFIYRIDPVTGELTGKFDTQNPDPSFGTQIEEFPNALAYDRIRNGIWIGAQRCRESGMPIYFWDLDTGTFTLAFIIPFSLRNPATGQSFLNFCFADGLAFDANDPKNPDDDELWFSDDVNPNIGVFKTNGQFLRGYDARTVHPSLATASGLAVGGQFLYIANNGGGDVFRADKTTNPLQLVDRFTSGDTRQEDMACDPVTFAERSYVGAHHSPGRGLPRCGNRL